MKKRISFILAAAMLLSLFTFVSCDEQTVNNVLDAALTVVEALPDAETGEGADAGFDTEEAESDGSSELTDSEPADEADDSADEAVKETEAAAEEKPQENEYKPQETEEKKPETEEKKPETEEKQPEPEPETEAAPVIDENGWYDDKENVALYIHTYGKLPPNYVSKNDAEDLYGWEGGALDQYAEGMAIGGSKFGNYEGLLPKKSGRQYYECDIGTVGTTSRGAKRIVYSNDGLIYYTDDHYESFELLYGEE